MSLAELAIGGMVGSAIGKSNQRDRYEEILDRKKSSDLKHLGITVRTVLKTASNNDAFINVVNSFLDTSRGSDESEEILIAAYNSYISKGNSNDDFYLNILDYLDKRHITDNHLNDLEEIKNAQNNVELSKLVEEGDDIVQEEFNNIITYFKTLTDEQLQMLRNEGSNKQKNILFLAKAGIITGSLIATIVTGYFQMAASNISGQDESLGSALMFLATVSMPMFPVDGILKKLLKTVGLKTFQELSKNDTFVKELSSKIETSINKLNSVDEIVSLLQQLDKSFNHDAFISHKLFPKIFENFSDETLEKIPSFFLEENNFYYEKKNPDKSLKNSYINKKYKKSVNK
jgi:hypothetical protein